MTITTKDGKECDGLDQAPFEPIAVIGMAALMPDATSIEEFWQNIIDAHVSIKEVPPSLGSKLTKTKWLWNVTEGKTYSKIGGFVEDLNSIGEDGDNLLAQYLKSIHVNYGQ